jgi:hypothetical protein
MQAPKSLTIGVVEPPPEVGAPEDGRAPPVNAEAAVTLKVVIKNDLRGGLHEGAAGQKSQ